jgi:hypothetical protein
MKTLTYRDFTIQVTEMKANGEQFCYAFLNGHPKFGTCSQYDLLTAYEKMLLKIDTYYKTK